MAAGPEILVRYIRRWAARPEADRAGDAALLNRFISEKDERAFAALVDRHGPLVFHVCRRVLGDVHEAEDAFQAAFLVLARKAASVHPREALAAWLHGVAHRVALKARTARVRRLRLAQPLPVPPADPRADPLAELSARDLLEIVDEEVRRLPDVYRLPVILCCLEGRSQEEAARQLGWTPGSVKGRLERGRTRLHHRLVRRGLTLSAALAGAELSRCTASAAVVARILAPTVQAALVFAAGDAPVARASSQAVTLAGEMLKGIALARMKLAAALLLATCLVTTGVFLRRADPARVLAGSDESLDPSRAKSALAAATGSANEHAAPQGEDERPIEVNGRVLDPRGNPFAGAKLYVGCSVHRFPPGREENLPVRQASYPLRATSSSDGRFHFVFSRSELDAQWLDDSRPAVVAVAGGYGPDWVEIGESDPAPTEAGNKSGLTLKLVEDQPVNGRILNPDRKPVAGAKIHVRDIVSASEEGVTRFIRGEFGVWRPRTWRGPLPGQPLSVTTDADGQFQLIGVGRDRIVNLLLEGPGIPDASLTAVARPSSATPDKWRVNAATFEYVALPRKLIRGVVRDKASGKPVAGVQMSAYQAHTTTLTDADGRYEIVGCPKGRGCLVKAQPQIGQPYFASAICIQQPTDPDSVTVDFDLTRGIELSGKVTDQSTLRPPRTAVVEYYPLFPNPHSSATTNGVTMAASSAVIQSDGSYRLVVLPGRGVVCVAASPRNSYATALIEENDLANLARDGIEHCTNRTLAIAVGEGRALGLGVSKYNALSLINPEERAAPLALDLAVQPARTVKGTLVGPDDKPLLGVDVVGLTATPNEETLDSASFTVTGLHPRGTRELLFRQSEKDLGRVLTIRGDETGPLKVRLEPCGWVIGRLVDKNGNPVPKVAVWPQGGSDLDLTSQTDRDGRFRVALLPGHQYFFTAYSRRLLGNVGGFNVESGQTKDLGDLTLAD